MSQHQAPTKKKSRLWLKLLLAGVLAIVLLVALAPMLFSGLIRGQAQSAIQDQVNGSVTIEGLSVSWFSGIEVNGVAIKAEGATLPSLEVGSLSFDGGIFRFLKEEISGKLKLKGLRVRAHRRNGEIDLSKLFKPSEKKKESKPLPALDIDLDCQDMSLSFYDEDAPAIHQGIDNLRLLLRSDKPTSLRLKGDRGLVLELDGKIISDGAIPPIDQMQLKGKLAAEQLDLRTWSGLLSSVCSRLEGVLTLDQSFELNGGGLTLKGPLEARDLAVALVGRPEGIRAKSVALSTDLSLDAAGKGRGDLSLDGRGLVIKGLPQLTGPFELALAKGSFTLAGPESLKISKLSLKGPALEVQGSGGYSWGQASSAAGQVNIRADLGTLSKLLADLPQATGSLASDLQLQMGAQGDLKVSGTTRIRDLSVASLGEGVPPIEEKEVVLRHDLQLDAKHLAMKDVGLKASFADIDLKGDIAPFWREGITPKGALSLVGHIDMGPLGTLLEKQLPDRLKGRLNLNAHLGAQDDGYALRLNATSPSLVLSSAKLAASELDLAAVKLHLQGLLSAAGDQIAISGFSLRSGPLDANFRGSISEIGKAGGPGFALKGNAKPRLDILGPALSSDWVAGQIKDGDARFDVQRKAGDLAIKLVEWRSPQLRARATGQLRQGEEGSPLSGPIDLQVNGDLSALKPFLGEDYPVQGSGPCTLKAKIALGEATRFDVDLSGKNWVLSGQALGDAPLNLATLKLLTSGVRKGSDESIDLDSFSLNLPFAQTSLAKPTRITMAPDGSGPRGRIHLRGRVDLERIPPQVYTLPEGLVARGRTDMSLVLAMESSIGIEDVSISCPNLFLQEAQGNQLAGRLGLSAKLDGKRFNLFLDGRELKLTPPNSPESFRSNLVVKADGSQGETPGSYNLQNLSVKAEGIDLNGSVDWNPKGASKLNLKGDLALEQLTRSWLVFFAPEIKAKGKGLLDLNLDLPAKDEAPDWSRASGHWKLRAPEVTKGSLLLQNLIIEGNLVNGVAKISEGTALVNGGKLDLGANIDLTQPETLWNGSLGIANLPLQPRSKPTAAKVVPLFAGTGVTVSGVAHAQLNFDGRGEEQSLIKRTLSGNGTLGMSAGRIQGGPIFGILSQVVGLPPVMEFEPFNANFAIKDGKILQDGLAIVSNAFDLRLKGTTSLDGAINYILRVQVKSSTPQWNRFAKVLDPEGFLPMKLGGSIDSPRLEPPDMATLLKGVVPSLIPGQPGKILGGLLGGKPKAGTSGAKKKNPIGSALDLLGGLGGKKKKKKN